MQGFPDISVVKNPPAIAENAGETGSIPGSGRCLEEGNANPLQYFLENPHGQSLVGYSPWGLKELYRTERLTHTQAAGCS